MRYFATRFRRRMAAGFAGDAVPAGAQTVNVPATGVGNLLRLPSRRINDPAAPARRLQGYLLLGGGAVGLTFTLQLWIAAGAGNAAGDWLAVGTPLIGVPPLTLFESVGRTMDADVVIQVTPSAALVGAETVDLFLEESD